LLAMERKFAFMCSLLESKPISFDGCEDASESGNRLHWWLRVS